MSILQDLIAAIRDGFRAWKHRRYVRAQRERVMAEPSPFDF